MVGQEDDQSTALQGECLCRRACGPGGAEGGGDSPPQQGIKGEPVYLTISVAAGVLPESITDLEEIMAWCAKALKASKEGGKNRFTRIAQGFTGA